MKPRELIFDLRRTVVPVVSAQQAAANLERFIALADEVKKRKDVYALNPDYHHALEWAEERIREILEET